MQDNRCRLRVNTRLLRALEINDPLLTVLKFCELFSRTLSSSDWHCIQLNDSVGEEATVVGLAVLENAFRRGGLFVESISIDVRYVEIFHNTAIDGHPMVQAMANFLKNKEGSLTEVEMYSGTMRENCDHTKVTSILLDAVGQNTSIRVLTLGTLRLSVANDGDLYALGKLLSSSGCAIKHLTIRGTQLIDYDLPTFSACLANNTSVCRNGLDNRVASNV